MKREMHFLCLGCGEAVSAPIQETIASFVGNRVITRTYQQPTGWTSFYPSSDYAAGNGLCRKCYAESKPLYPTKGAS